MGPLISTNNIARGMVCGSQVRFQFTKNTFSTFKTIYKIMPPLSDLPVRFSFPLTSLSRLAAAELELADHGTTPAVALPSTSSRWAFPYFHRIESDWRNREIEFVRRAEGMHHRHSLAGGEEEWRERESEPAQPLPRRPWLAQMTPGNTRGRRSRAAPAKLETSRLPPATHHRVRARPVHCS
jgi:hypothetical protein